MKIDHLVSDEKYHTLCTPVRASRHNYLIKPLQPSSCGKNLYRLLYSTKFYYEKGKYFYKA
jgi:hypothetical protein